MILVDNELRAVVEILDRALPYDDTGITLELYDVENLHGFPFTHALRQAKSYHHLVALMTEASLTCEQFSSECKRSEHEYCKRE